MREYRYRKHIRWGQYALPILFGAAVVITWIVIAAVGVMKGSSGAQVVYVLAALLTVVCLVVGVPAWWIYYRMAGVVIRLEDDAFVYRHRGGEKRIAYDRLGPLSFPSARYVGGWVAIRSGAETIRLTVVVEGLGALMRELKAALDARGLSASYDRARLFGFMKTAEYSDQSWERAYEIALRLMLASLVGAILAIGLALLANARGPALVLWTVISALWPAGVYGAAEFMFGRRLARLSDPAAFTCPPRDPMWEREILRKAIAWGAGLYGLACAAAWFWLRR